MSIFIGGTGTANELDDYEEGTWTPADGSGASISYTIDDTATYTRIGRLVHVQFSLTHASNSNGNSAAIGGLPFTQGTNYGSGIVGWTSRDNPAGVTCHVGSNNVIYLMDNTSASSSGGKHLLNSEMSGVKVIGNATYYAST